MEIIQQINKLGWAEIILIYSQIPLFIFVTINHFSGGRPMNKLIDLIFITLDKLKYKSSDKKS